MASREEDDSLDGCVDEVVGSDTVEFVLSKQKKNEIFVIITIE